MKKNSISDLERLELVARRIAEGGVDITREYEDWINVTFACASQGEAARECYHTICGQYPGYRREECDAKFDNCLKTGRGDVTIATVMQMAKDAGIDVSLPKGRRPKSEAQKQEEQKNHFDQLCEWLEPRFVFRFNTISEQIEVMSRDAENEWKDMDDRQLSSLLTDLHADKVLVSKANLETYVSSEKFAPAYNPIKAYAKTLKPWKPIHKDYIADLFDHLGLAENEYRDFMLKMAKKWYVWMVAVATDHAEGNQLMLILSGEIEGSGKSTFVERFLPQPLRKYIKPVTQLSQFKDKDELLALARSMVCFYDEIVLNTTTLNKLKNYVGGAGSYAINERTQYGHFSARRKVHASWIATTNQEIFLPESTGDRRFVVLPVSHRGRNYRTLPQERAFAQAYYLVTHPKAFPLEITEEEIKKLKEINEKYVQESLLISSIPTILRQPKSGEQAQAVTTGEIINWLTSRYGPNTKEFTPTKIGIAMKKLGYEPSRTNKGKCYIVVRILMPELEQEGKHVAKQILNPEIPL